MKHDWKYIKLGDIISPAKVVRNGANKKFPVLSITMRDGIVFQSSRFKKSIASVDTSDYKVVYNGQLVIAFPIDEGLIYTQDIVDAGIMSPAYNVWNVDFLEIDRKFLVLYLHCPFSMAYYKSKLRGTTMRRRSMPKEDLLNMPLPVPSFSVQQSVVSELDKINELIRLKKEQLKDYDNLAQSIFYEMFGDPVVNEKGWEVKKLGDVCKFTQGTQVPIEEQHLSKENGLVQFLRIIDFTQGKDAPRFVKCSNDKYILHEREIAIVRYGTPGFVCYGKIGAIANNLFKITPNQKDMFEFEFLVHWLNTEAFQSAVKSKQYGAALQAIKFSTIQGINIIIPSLTVQRSFATRISQIDKQKKYIEESIKDLETLLASRMQYWFD